MLVISQRLVISAPRGWGGEGLLRQKWPFLFFFFFSSKHVWFEDNSLECDFTVITFSHVNPHRAKSAPAEKHELSSVWGDYILLARSKGAEGCKSQVRMTMCNAPWLIDCSVLNGRSWMDMKTVEAGWGRRRPSLAASSAELEWLENHFGGGACPPVLSPWRPLFPNPPFWLVVFNSSFLPRLSFKLSLAPFLWFSLLPSTPFSSLKTLKLEQSLIYHYTHIIFSSVYHGKTSNRHPGLAFKCHVFHGQCVFNCIRISICDTREGQQFTNHVYD